MAKSAVSEYMLKLARISDIKKKAELMLNGCLYFFPFNRAHLFTYSPLTHLGEGYMMAEKEKMISIEKVQEDVSSILPLFNALLHNEPILLGKEDILHFFPSKYHASLEAPIAVIPISLLNIVVSFVLLDKYKHKKLPAKQELVQLSYYFTSPFLPVPEKNHLSNREIEVLQLLANGHTIKEMAVLLSVSDFTVRDYISSVLRKLGVNHRAQAVAAGMRKGIIK